MERRRAPRTRLRELVYIGIGNDNGGVVLDVSDGGLSFHAVASVQQSSPIHISLSVQGGRRFEGTAKVAWNSAAGKCAGLCFTHLPEEVREQIQIWSNQPQLNLPNRGKNLPPSGHEPPPIKTNEAAPAMSLQTIADNTSLSAAISEQGLSLPIIFPEPATVSVDASADLKPAEHSSNKLQADPISMVPTDPECESEGTAVASRYVVPSRYGIVAIVVTVVLASIMAIAGSSYAYLHGAGKFLLHLADKIRDSF